MTAESADADDSAAVHVAALHMAARRYCKDRHDHWADTYGVMRQGRIADRYTDEDYRTFPRYLVLDAIRTDIERWLAGDVHTLDDARGRLVHAARTASSPFTDMKEPLALAAMAEERAAFERFALDSDEAAWAEAEPLPYRRVLDRATSKALYAEFRRRWGDWSSGDSNRSAIPEHLTLHDEVLRALPILGTVRSILAARGVAMIIELPECDDAVELALGEVDFQLAGESVFRVPGGDWMIYVSHESSITFGEPWLVAALRAALPRLDEFEYRGWDDPPSARGIR